MICSGVYMSAKDGFKYQIVSKFLSGSMNRNESADLLQVSPRTVSRIAKKVKNHGVFGIKHGNTGRSPKIKHPEDLKVLILNLLRTEYFDFNIKHFHEILLKAHDIDIPYKTLWRWCKELSFLRAKPPKPALRF